MRKGACGWTRRHLWRYVEGSLPSALRARVEQHLAVCVPCRAAWVQAQEVLEALQAGKPLTAEQQRILQRARARTPLSKVAIALIVVLLVGAGVVWWRMQGESLWALWGTGVPRPQPTAASAPAAQPTPSAPSEPIVGILTTSEPSAVPEPEPKPPAVAPKAIAEPRPPKPPSGAPQRRARHDQPRPSQPRSATRPTPTLPAEGTVEVYDESGALIKREQLPRRP